MGWQKIIIGDLLIHVDLRKRYLNWDLKDDKKSLREGAEQ